MDASVGPPAADPGAVSTIAQPDAAAVIDPRFVEYRRTRDRALRNELISDHRDLARRIARRYAGRSEAYDDLVQVAMVGVLKAVERFDPERGLEFSRFASVTVDGELKRHFRDNTWSIHVPRGTQDLFVRIGRVLDQLHQRFGRPPSVPELASALDVSEDQVLEALDAGSAYRTLSLDAPVNDSQQGRIDFAVGADDRAFADTDLRETMRSLLERLPERERRIVEMRFFEDKVQTDIADELGISQMHVSRLLTRAMARLRALMNDLEI